MIAGLIFWKWQLQWASFFFFFRVVNCLNIEFFVNKFFELKNSTFDYPAWYCLSLSIFWLNSTDVCAFFHKRIWKIPKLKQHSGLGRQCSEALSSNITLQLSLSSEALSISHPIYLVNQTASVGLIVLIQVLFTP